MDLILLRKYRLAGNAWAYEFEPTQPLGWTAGQFIKVELPHLNPDEEGTVRRFTISAAPHEGLIRISTRYTGSTFKQALHVLEPGQSLKLIDTPAGDFVWSDQPRPLVFVAQGIGITPFYAMLADRVHRDVPIPAELYYANRTPDVPFLPELKDWAASRPEFSLQLSAEPFRPDRLAELVPDLATRLIYISGPGSYIKLLAPPVNLPVAQLKQDLFPNYARLEY
jgi:ferredoxin-NADP reductase